MYYMFTNRPFFSFASHRPTALRLTPHLGRYLSIDPSNDLLSIHQYM